MNSDYTGPELSAHLRELADFVDAFPFKDVYTCLFNKELTLYTYPETDGGLLSRKLYGWFLKNGWTMGPRQSGDTKGVSATKGNLTVNLYQYVKRECKLVEVEVVKPAVEAKPATVVKEMHWVCES